MIGFLDLTPRPATEMVKLQTASGTVDVELCGLSLATLSELAKRFPSFGRIIEGASASVIEASDALPALIAAGLGHPGSAEYEEKARAFGAGDMLAMVRAVMRLTLAQPESESPLPAPVLVNGDAAPELTSPSRLSS